MKLQSYYYPSPIGFLEIVYDDEFIYSMKFLDSKKENNSDNISQALSNCVKQLTEYFEGGEIIFDLSLKLGGTEFQRKVWTGLGSIKYGSTISYKNFSLLLGNVNAIRAVAHSNALNPFAVVIPCHRVIGRNGELTGYAGGLWRKRWLLNHENKHSPTGQIKLVLE